MRKHASAIITELVFDPDSFKGRSNELKFERSKLADFELLEYAKIASELRT